jgi:Domain of unknown function (DUF1963)
MNSPSAPHHQIRRRQLSPHEQHVIENLEAFVQQARRSRVVPVSAPRARMSDGSGQPAQMQPPTTIIPEQEENDDSIRRHEQVLGAPEMEDATTLFGSRYGGAYAWPNQDIIIAGSTTFVPPPPDDFFCLLQINLRELSSSSCTSTTTTATTTTDETAPTTTWSSSFLPQSGLLQFFIRADDNYGMNDRDFRGSGFRVVYHADLTADVSCWHHRPPTGTSNCTATAERMTTSFLPLGTRADELLTTYGIPITSFVRQDNVPPSRNDYRIETSTRSLLTGQPDRGTASSSSSSSFAFEQWYEERIIPLDHESSDAAAWLGGHPRWSQGDIRTHYPNEQYEALVSFASDGEIFQWGDMGDATFLIKEKDLLQHNFTNMLYSWDCF